MSKKHASKEYFYYTMRENEIRSSMDFLYLIKLISAA
jgi:hypothetical protein